MTAAEWREVAYVGIPLLVVIVVFFGAGIYKHVFRFFKKTVMALKALLAVMGIHKGMDTDEINESLEVAGYAYDPLQDIFHSIIDPWQRSFGYCRLYDEAAAPMGMIIDCEPIYFEYGGKKWLIELWKGQYDLTTGCEVGVYTAKGLDLHIPGVFNGTFYECVDEPDFLRISYSLKKNGKTLFVRKGIHWWLTGFKLGVFSEPWELTMYINITLKDKMMRDAFVEGLRHAGYSDHEMAAYGNSVSLLFAKPHTAQPLTRTKATDALIQKKNKLLCDQYQEITKGCNTIVEKMKAVHEKAPELYGHITGLGKPKKLYSAYKKIKKYLS